MSKVRSRANWRTTIRAGAELADGTEAQADRDVTFRVGDIVDADHWAVLANPHRFEPVDDDEERQQRLAHLADLAARQRGEQATPERTAPQAHRGAPERPMSLRDDARRRVDELRGRVPDSGVERLTRAFEAAEASPDDAELTLLSRWMVATSRPAYARAVGRLFRDPEHGHREFSAEELDAYRAAKAVQRAMNLGSDSAGGFLLPTHLDPSINLVSDGSVDPMRALARQVTVATNEWHGITSAGVTARWAAEGTEANDDSPTVDGPSIPTHKADAFVAATIEAAADTTIGAQVATLFADAKAQLEATGFVTGTGNDQPTGVVTALAGSGSQVNTGAAGTYARDDVIGLQEAVPPRFRVPGAAFMGSLEVLNATRDFPKMDAGVDESLVDESGPRPRVRGWEWHENSSMSSTVGTGEHIAVAGDFRQYLVVDRVGATVEYIPHLFGANQRPTGHRGWYLHWRVGGDVLVENALRLLTVA